MTTTPTPEAIEAAQRAMMWKKLPFGGKDATVSLDANAAHAAAKLALSAAYPLMEAQAKAEALTRLADDFDELASRASYGASEDVMETWLEAAKRARAATIEGNDS